MESRMQDGVQNNSKGEMSQVVGICDYPANERYRLFRSIQLLELPCLALYVLSLCLPPDIRQECGIRFVSCASLGPEPDVFEVSVLGFRDFSGREISQCQSDSRIVSVFDVERFRQNSLSLPKLVQLQVENTQSPLAGGAIWRELVCASQVLLRELQLPHLQVAPAQIPA